VIQEQYSVRELKWRYSIDSKAPDSQPSQVKVMLEPVETSFLEELMRHLIDQMKIPKVQVERAIAPILGIFIADALSTEDDRLDMICAEFPLRIAEFPLCKKDGQSRKSTNIDWLLYSATHKRLVFLELKTTDAVNTKQADKYRAVIKEINAEIKAGRSVTVFDDVTEIKGGSRRKEKYAEVLGNCKGKNERCLDIEEAKLVYLVPEYRAEKWRQVLVAEAQVLIFKELPPEIRRFPSAWKIIRKHLVQLDSPPRRPRVDSLPAPAVMTARAT
jgi:hypothetical protein